MSPVEKQHNENSQTGSMCKGEAICNILKANTGLLTGKQFSPEILVWFIMPGFYCHLNVHREKIGKGFKWYCQICFPTWSLKAGMYVLLCQFKTVNYKYNEA